MIEFDCSKFYRYDEMSAWLYKMEKNFPDKMKLTTLTSTPEGRSVYLATLADFTLGDDAEKRGAYFIQAGLHSQEVSGPTAAMAVIERILCRSPEVLRETVFYIAPNVNPDGMELALGASFKGIRSRLRPISGLANALIPCDINGDGMILNMRRKNPFGKMKEIEGYPGIMTAREPGDTDGIFYDMWHEGIIENYDGGEPVLGVERIDFNRCYPTKWEPDLGKEYPLHSPEMRAIVEFEAAHPNIFASVDFHNGPAAIAKPSIIPKTECDINNLILIDRIGKTAEKIIGIPLVDIANDYKNPYEKPVHDRIGSSCIWNYEGLGRSQYIIELGVGLNFIGMDYKEIFSKKPLTESLELMSTKYLCKNEEFWDKNKNDIFVPWQPFDHPQLGQIEIGGFKGGNASYISGEYMGKLLPRVNDFILRHAAMAPKLCINNEIVTKISEGIYQIQVEVMNTGELGTRVMQGVGGVNACKKVRTYIETTDKNIKILSHPTVYEVEQLKSLEKAKMEWFVQAEAPTEILVKTENPRSKTASIKIVLPLE